MINSSQKCWNEIQIQENFIINFKKKIYSVDSLAKINWPKSKWVGNIMKTKLGAKSSVIFHYLKIQVIGTDGVSFLNFLKLRLESPHYSPLTKMKSFQKNHQINH
jgi:hypothetical protein